MNRREFLRHAWAMHPPALADLQATFLAGAAPPSPEAAFGAGPEMSRASGVAIIPVRGVIVPRGRFGASSETLSAMLAAATRAKRVGAIVLDVDSPGGTVAGTPELGQAVADAARIKPVIAHVNPFAASAAYWVAAQASEIVSTPSGEVGSIGVWMGHMDISKMAEEAGVKITLVSAGKYKVEGNPFEPLGDEAKKEFQRLVDSSYQDFLSAVATGRKTDPETVKQRFGEGRMVEAREAQTRGMIDRLATLGQTIAGALDRSTAGRIGTIREFESFLRDAGGFSVAAAKVIARGGFGALEPDHRDEDEPEPMSQTDQARARAQALAAQVAALTE